MKKRLTMGLVCTLLLVIISNLACAAIVDNETAALLIESVSKENFDYFDVEVDEDGQFICRVGVDGVSVAVAMAKAAGYDETFPEWVEVKDNMIAMYDSMKELLETMEVDNPNPLIFVVNENNPENALLAIAYGVVLYDVLAE